MMYHVAAPWQMYQPSAPWQTLLQKWTLPVGLTDFVSQSKPKGDLKKEIQNAFETFLKDARVLAGSAVPLGSAMIMDDVQAFPPEIQTAVRKGVVAAMQKAGFEYCDEWVWPSSLQNVWHRENLAFKDLQRQTLCSQNVHPPPKKSI